jgi:hypothetical protein
MVSSFLASTAITSTTSKTNPAPTKPVSGRPANLLDHHRLVTITGGAMWNAAEAFVHDTYVQLGYTKPSARRQVEELAPYESASMFHAVIDESDRIVGTVRSIYGTYEDLPVGKFHHLDDAGPDPLCELSSLVVSPTMRSTGVIEHLYRVGWSEAYRMDCVALVAIIDDWLLEVFKENYRLPFLQIGEGHEYMGGVPVPAVLPLDGHYEDCISQNPKFAGWMLEIASDDELERWGIRPPVDEPRPVTAPTFATVR